MAGSRDIESIIERQAAFWEVRRRAAAEGGEEARRTFAHLSEGPWITVSRQWGAGGRELAEALAGKLGWQVFDREILHSIAEQTHRREAILERLDEHAIGTFNDYLAQMVVPDTLSRAGYLAEVARVVWGVARQGNAIILGRGANWLLHPRFGLRLRVIGSMETRVARLAELEAADPRSVESRLSRHDEEQAAFIRQTFGREIDDPAGYDLVINLQSLGPECAAKIAYTAIRCKLD